MDSREMAAVMLAHADGKKIEFAYREYPDRWNDMDTPSWNWQCAVYRVKKEPIKISVFQYMGEGPGVDEYRAAIHGTHSHTFYENGHWKLLKEIEVAI
jgi:hypothetical protein